MKHMFTPTTPLRLASGQLESDFCCPGQSNSDLECGEAVRDLFLYILESLSKCMNFTVFQGISRVLVKCRT